MDLNSMLNPVADGRARAAAAAQSAVAANGPHQPQRSASHVQPLTYQNLNSSPHAPPTVPLPRTTSLPAQVNHHHRRMSSESVSPKTMPPPAPVPLHHQTPSPVMSRKRSLSISDHQHTPQPMLKKRKYTSPPPWARRERDGYRFEPAPNDEVNAYGQNHQQATPQSNHQSSVPPPSAGSMHAPPHTPVNTHPPPRFEPSIDNQEPYSDLERTVCNFLCENVITRDWSTLQPNITKIEIEAKLGRLIDTDRTGMRLNLGLASDAALEWRPENKRLRTKFESSMTLQQHSFLNQYLNYTVQQAAAEPNRQKIDYKHLYETDYFYDIPAHAIPRLDPAILEHHNRMGRRGPPRLRMTSQKKTNQISAVIVKTKLEDIEVHCPNDEFDFRISISLESQWRGDDWQQFPEHLDQGVRTTRDKDRLSYKHQFYQVDLTQVTPTGTQKNKTHELEIEIDADRLYAEGQKMIRGEPNDFEKMVHVFVNSVKVINRAARPDQAPGQ